MLTAALILAAVAVAYLAWEFRRAPLIDERTQTALALLQPDHPALPEPTPLADEVAAWLAAQPTTHDRENPL